MFPETGKTKLTCATAAVAAVLVQAELLSWGRFFPANMHGDRGPIHVAKAFLWNTLTNYLGTTFAPAIQMRHRFLLGGFRFICWTTFWVPACNLAFVIYSFIALPATSGRHGLDNVTSSHNTTWANATKTMGSNALGQEQPLFSEITALVLGETRQVACFRAHACADLTLALPS